MNFSPDFSEQVYKLTQMGCDIESIADFYKTDKETIYHWMEENAEFHKAILKGRLEADAEVANALYQRAIGYSHPETKVLQYEGEPIKVEVTKHYPPDTQAAIFWLKNRQPELWNEKAVLNINENKVYDFGNLTTEELKALESKLLSRQISSE